MSPGLLTNRHAHAFSKFENAVYTQLGHEVFYVSLHFVPVTEANSVAQQSTGRQFKGTFSSGECLASQHIDACE